MKWREYNKNLEKIKDIINKYTISQEEYSLKEYQAEYFVLRLDNNCNDIDHLRASKKAILTYAKELKNNPELSSKLISKYKELDNKYTNIIPDLYLYWNSGNSMMIIVMIILIYLMR